MTKPAHQWETRLHQAFRLPSVDAPGFEHDARAEAFELRFHDGRRGRAVLGLARQEVDETAANDPELVHAVKCWLCARGQRDIALVVRNGEHTRALVHGRFAASE